MKNPSRDLQLKQANHRNGNQPKSNSKWKLSRVGLILGN